MWFLEFCRIVLKNLNEMTCISRRDKNKNLFSMQNNIKRRRWNLYPLIAFEKGMLVCANESYPLEDLCLYEYNAKSQPCTLLGTTETVDISIGA